MFSFVNINTRKEDIALLISNEWKNRAAICKNDFMNLIEEKKEIVEKYIDEKDYENADKEMYEIDKLSKFIEEIEDVLLKYRYDHFPISVIENIQFYEREIYNRYMTDEIIEILKKKEEDRQRFSQISLELANKVDEMWDNNCSEEEIKSFIEDQIKLMFPYNTEQINLFLRDNLFITLTAGKNVRIALKDEEISKLKKEKGRTGTCGTCLEEYNESEDMVILKCNHAYHENCIVPWLKMSVYCPTCRQDLRD